MSKTAFLFPGQGSQKVGMGADLVEAYPDVRARYFDAADEILGMDLTRLCFEGPEDDLRATDNTQPAIFTMSMAVLDVLVSEGIQADATAGHSLGEYAALVLAGVLEFPDALRLVRRRGELMAAVNRRTPGTMAAVMGLPPDVVDALCATARKDGGGVVEPANYNEPDQTVISGEVGPVERASTLAAAAGARVVPLRVGAPFHSSLMDALGKEFAVELDRYDFSDPTMDVVANVTGDYVRTASDVKEALRRQVAGAVRWTQTLQRLAADGVDVFVEVGPGRVLSGLVMKTLPDATTHSTTPVKRLVKTIEEMRS